jgi:hypothetical protein
MRQELNQDFAAAKIQSRARGKMSRKQTGKKIVARRQSAVRIQTQARQRAAKSKVQVRREEDARRKTQIATENARLKAAKQNATGKADKSLSRETEAMRQELNQDFAAAKIQSRARGKMTRKQTGKKIVARRQSAVRIQTQARQRAAKSKVQIRREEDARRKTQIQEENARLSTMKANAVGRADKSLSKDVLARREQLKDESDTAYQARVQQEADTRQELSDMKANATARSEFALSEETQEMRAILAEA